MSKKRKLILFSVGTTVLIGAGILVFIMGHFQTKAEVRVESNVASEVYLDGKDIGATPQTYETTNLKPVLQIVPHEKNSNYLPYETTLSLTPQTKTIVRHNFNTVISGATSQILSFEFDRQNKAPMTIVTNPESAYVFVNNEYVGTSPLRIEKPASTYSVQVMHTGFQAMQVTLKNSPDYNLTAFLDLAVQTTVPVNPKSSAQSKGDQQNSSSIVRITKTPGGYSYVRVHEGPSEASQELSRATLGREFPFEGYTPLKDWIEINLNASQSGWVRSLYATVSATAK